LVIERTEPEKKRERDGDRQRTGDTPITDTTPYRPVDWGFLDITTDLIASL
jgi:hypothetical protein